MTIHTAYQRLLLQLYEVYDDREAANIANIVIEHVTGQKRIDRIMYKDIPVNEEQQAKLEQYADELLQHKPLQYVLGQSWFYGFKFQVNEHVLIPRPETEELVEWIIKEAADYITNEDNNINIIDIGTGSGCIPIALKKNVRAATVSAVDISEDALKVAKLNAQENEVDVQFLQANFLDHSTWNNLSTYQIIVSNPPYIKQSEESEMRENVVKYEPHIALFVPDNNALVFYEALALFGLAHLDAGGAIYMEINEALGDAVKNLFEEEGYKTVVIKKDMQGKDRMVKASFS